MKTYYIKSALAFLALGFVACDDEDKLDQFYSPVQDDSSIATETDQSSVSKLVFNWQPVAGVMQYGYSLANPDGKVVRSGLTKETTVTLTRLEANTTYVLTVEAFGDNGEATKRFKIEAKTAPILPLSAPEANSMTFENKLGRVFVTWNPVPNAQWYDYVLYNIDEEQIAEGKVTEAQSIHKGLEDGEYILQIIANSDDEHFSPSEMTEYIFERSRSLVETKKIIYTNSEMGEIKTDLQIYDDQSYVVSAFMGVKNYNLEFAIEDDYDSESGSTVVILNPSSIVSGWEYVNTGLSETSTLGIYTGKTYCYYKEYEEKGKIITFWASLDDGTAAYDQLQWDDPMDALTIDSFVGDYSITSFSGQAAGWFPLEVMNTWTDFSNVLYDVKVVKIDEEKLEIQGLLGIAHTATQSADADNDRVYAYPDIDGRVLRIPAQYCHDANGNEVKTYGIDTYAQTHSKPSGKDIEVTYTAKMKWTLSGWSPWWKYDRIKSSQTTLEKK